MTTEEAIIGSVVEGRREELGIDADTLAELLGWDSARVRELESGDFYPSFEELHDLSLVLGLDLETFDPARDDRPGEHPELTTLLKSPENSFRSYEWRAVLEAASIARETVQLEDWRGLPDRYSKLKRQFHPKSLQDEEPWRQGQALAEQVREELDRSGEILSMYSFCDDIGVNVIETHLYGDVSALCFNDEYHGPTVVLNLNGHNESLLPRRFTLAHEICHILFDEHEMEGLKHFDREVGYHESSFKPALEKRADAFAIHLLCPDSLVKSAWEEMESQLDELSDRLRAMMEKFGVSRTAMIAHLQNLNLMSREAARHLSGVESNTPERVREAERQAKYTADADFSAIPRERRRRLLEQALRAFRDGVIGRSKLVELLNVSGDELQENLNGWLQLVD
jgi:Zn-dependent peptidase ImmA (M78 family)